jgi:very-short-patch-repair endonuclease
MKKVPIARGQHVEPEKRELARCLRRRQTRAESKFWEMVRDRRLDGMKFRRQQVIQGFVADFYCPQCELVVEIDGDYHMGMDRADRERELAFRALGLSVVRFTNREVLDEEQEVVRQLRKHLNR